MKRNFFIVISLVFGLLAPTLAADISPLIDIDAAKLADGPVSAWKNAGTLGGSFDVVPIGGAVVANVEGRNAVTFDGLGQRLVSSFASPASITGDSAYSIAVWVNNPKIETEEAVICWAPRTSGEGKCAQLNYGSAKEFGAVTHWGKNDMGFDGGVPDAGKWHLIAVTYGGKADPVEKVYVDGKLNASEKKALDVASGGSIYLGGAGSEKLFSGALASVQIYDYALSPDEIAFVSGTGGTKPKAALVDLSVNGLPEGELTKWVNKGTLGGSFGQLKYAPVAESVDSKKAVSFSKGGWLQSSLALPKGAFTLEIWANVSQDGLQADASPAALSVGSVAKNDALRIALGRNAKNGAIKSGPVAAGFEQGFNLKQWHQVAYAYADGTLRIYVDGQLDSAKPCKLAVPSDLPMNLGAAWQNGKGIPYAGFDGWISRLCVYDSAMTQREIRAHNGMLDAFNPSPADAATLDTLDATLTWEVGNPATKTCRVYFGESADSLADKGGISASKPQFGPVKLEIGRTYYWSVDQLAADGSVIDKGQIWKFTADAGKANTPAPRTAISAVPVSTATLTWTPGKFATDQTIYFAPEDQWANPTKAKLSPTAHEYKIPAKLDYGKSYSWRVDNSNGGSPATTGDTWTFRTEDKLSDTDVTFFGISDLHYTGPESNKANQDLIRIMNAFPGTAYPAEVGGNVATPRGVVVTGDIANAGRQPEWDSFVQDYGLNRDASLAYPIYELWGNHDGRTTDVVAQGIKQRNPSRPNLAMISKNGFHYSWDWGKVHFTCANIYPAQVSKIVIPNDPIYSMEFIRQDLEKNVGKSGRPVVIQMHYGLDGGGAGWWTKDEQDEFWSVVKNYNVIAILFGHTHGGGNYKWNGIDMVNIGGSLGGSAARQFVVFHVTDKEFVVARRYPDKWGTVLRKSITGMGEK